MGYLIAVDTSISMARAPDGGTKKEINGMIEKSRFELAADIVESILQMAARLNQEPVVHLYRLGHTYVSLGEVSSVEDVVTLLTKEDGKDVELFGCANFSQFMRFTHERLEPGIDDKIIILTDCSTFVGDVNYSIGCETRFIIVNSNKETMSEMQLEEMDEIAASSVGYEASPENEMMYHHFFLADYPSTYELSQSVFEELFEMSTYTLEMGHLTTQMRIGHSFYKQGVEKINILGFLRPTALLNMESTGTHFCHPVFYEEPLAPTETTASEGGDVNVTEISEDDDSMDDSDMGDSSPEYTEVEEEVTDDEEEGELKDDKPRASFIPTKALSSGLPREEKRIDFSSLFGDTSSPAELPDFVPPPKPAAAATPAVPAAPATPAAPVRKYKVVSRSSGVEKVYVAGAVTGPAVVAPVDIPSPAFEPLEEPKPDAKKASPSSKKNSPTPPAKKTKRVKKKVLKKKSESSYQRQQRRAAARARAEMYLQMHQRDEDEVEEEAPKRQQYDRDDVALVIDAKEDGAESESCWSVRDGEFSDTETLKKVREEMVEEEKKQKEEEEKKENEEEMKRKEEESKKSADEEKKKEDASEEENKDEKKKKEGESVDVEMKEEPSEEKKDDDVTMKDDKEENGEGSVAIPNPFQPSRRRRRRREVTDDDATAPYLVQMVTEAMRLEEMNAVCVMDNGEYAVLSTDQTEEGDDVLVISTIINQDMLPPMIPQFEQLTTIFDDTTEVDNVYLTQPVGEQPSYIVARSSWFNEAGIEADMVRVRKNLKKIPERLPHFYNDVNRMRQHAYGVCFQSYLPTLADQLIAEAKEFGEEAEKHATYVATYYKNVVAPAEVKDIEQPSF